MRWSGVVGLAGLLLGVSTCRDAPDLFDPEDSTPSLGPEAYQLTFAPGREVTPAWTAGGDSLFYLAEHPRLNPSDADDTVSVTSIVHVIPADGGGPASRVFPTLQFSNVGVSFFYAAPNPDGLVAAFILGQTAGPICLAAVAFCTDSVGPAPRLKSAEIRLREPGSGGPVEADQRLEIVYDGREFDTSVNPQGLDGLHRVRNHPFQQLFNDGGRVSSRLSWSPEGDRLVFSDGLRLATWNPATDEVVPIPGSEDGLNPAWSPAGDWIAYERLERGQLTEISCVHRIEGRATCVEERRTWTVPGRSLAIVRPDGATVRLLVEADEGINPTWSPDGRTIYFERDNRIWSVDISGLDATPVQGTTEGHEPAVSPDGTRLAFSRVDPETGEADIWVEDLP